MSDSSSRPSSVEVAFIAFLIIGLALPVLPFYVHKDLGFSTFVVGLVAGSQFTASLLSRFWAGHHVDSGGAKRAVVTGLLIAAVAGLFYLLSLHFVREPVTSVTILLLGRRALGAAKSFIITGALNWGLALGGPQNAGKVMAWAGIAMNGEGSLNGESYKKRVKSFIDEVLGFTEAIATQKAREVKS